MRYCSLCFFIISITALSCSEKKTAFVFSSEEELMAELVQFDEVIAPIRFLAKNNVLFVSQNVSNSLNSDLIYVYTFPDLKLVTSFGQKGRGPDEFSSYVFFCQSNNENAYIGGYDPRTFKKFSLDDPFELVNQNTIDLDFIANMSHPYIINDSILIYYNWTENYIRKYDIINQLETGRITFEGTHWNSPNLSHDSGHSIITDSLIIYLYQYKRQIDVYDVETMQLKRRISDPKAPFRVNDFESVVRGDVYYHFNTGFAGKDYFIASYTGDLGNKTDKSFYLELYDYDLNPIKRFKVDKWPNYGFVIDEKSRTIIGYSPKYENSFIKYNY